MSDTPATTILIADDDPSALLLAEAALAGAGLMVHTAADGQEALARFAEVNPDTVILDVDMPKMNGIEACREIRVLSGARLVPIGHLSEVAIGMLRRALEQLLDLLLAVERVVRGRGADACLVERRHVGEHRLGRAQQRNHGTRREPGFELRCLPRVACHGLHVVEQGVGRMDLRHGTLQPQQFIRFCR